MRKLAIFSLSFAAATAVMVWLPSPLCVVVFICALLTAVGSFFVKRHRILAVRIGAFGLLFGLLWSAGYEALFFHPAQSLVSECSDISARITAFPEETKYGIRVTARLDGVSTMLYMDQDAASLRPGDIVSGTFRLETPQDDSVGRYYRSRGVALLGYLRGEATIRRADSVSLRDIPALAANALRERVDTVFPSDVAPFLRALLTGDRSRLTNELTEQMSATGISHIVSVSGMHVSLVAGLVYVLCLRRRKAAAVLTLLVTLFFAAMMGFTPSVSRAFVMLALASFAPLLGRENDPPTTLSFALFIILCCNPYAVAGAGLQLSFAAMAGLLAYASPLYDHLTAFLPKKTKRHSLAVLCRLWRAVAAAAAMSLSANLFTVPLTALLFDSVSLVFLPANLIALPALTLAFSCGEVVLLLSYFLPGVASLAGKGIAVLVRFALWVIQSLAQFPLAAVPASEPLIALWLAVVYVLLLMFLFNKKRRKPLRLISAAVLALCIALTILRLPENGTVLTAFDVGQGQCLLYENEGTRVMIDCGGSDGEETIARRLFLRGKSRIDVLILTHFDADHVNGVIRLLQNADVRQLYVPDLPDENGLFTQISAAASQNGTELVLVTEDLTLEYPGGRVQLFAPLGKATRNNGLSALLSAGDYDVLITGDLPQTQERLLLNTHVLPDIEVLVAGHHGAKNSTSEELLTALRPEIVVISVGENSYGHPSQEVLDRIAAIGAQVERTDEQGQIRIRR